MHQGCGTPAVTSVHCTALHCTALHCTHPLWQSRHRPARPDTPANAQCTVRSALPQLPLPLPPDPPGAPWRSVAVPTHPDTHGVAPATARRPVSAAKKTRGLRAVLCGAVHCAVHCAMPQCPSARCAPAPCAPVCACGLQLPRTPATLGSGHCAMGGCRGVGGDRPDTHTGIAVPWLRCCVALLRCVVLCCAVSCSGRVATCCYMLLHVVLHNVLLAVLLAVLCYKKSSLRTCLFKVVQ